MSEYWKSTPKYWCKYCKVYVRDTNLEKKNHESTPRHQGNIQRSLRTLHRESDKEQREAARAKAEVARLNGIVSGEASKNSGKPTSTDLPWAKKAPVAARATEQKSTLEDRRRQAEQLASMGVAIPDEYRKDLAMASTWQVVSETPIIPLKEDPNPNAKAVGVRKRKMNGDEEDEESVVQKRKVWGTAVRSYPGSRGGDDALDDLLNGGILTIKTKSEAPEGSAVPKEEEEGEPTVKEEDAGNAKKDTSEEGVPSTAKQGFKTQSERIKDEAPSNYAEVSPSIKKEEGEEAPQPSAPPVLFKKRKAAFTRRT